jgi:hypothetical protein
VRREPGTGAHGLGDSVWATDRERHGVDFPRAGKRRSCSCCGYRVKPQAALPDDVAAGRVLVGLSIAAFLRLSSLSRSVFSNPDFENLWLMLCLKGLA